MFLKQDVDNNAASENKCFCQKTERIGKQREERVISFSCVVFERARKLGVRKTFAKRGNFFYITYCFFEVVFWFILYFFGQSGFLNPIIK